MNKKTLKKRYKKANKLNKKLKKILKNRYKKAQKLEKKLKKKFKKRYKETSKLENKLKKKLKKLQKAHHTVAKLIAFDSTTPHRTKLTSLMRSRPAANAQTKNSSANDLIRPIDNTVNNRKQHKTNLRANGFKSEKPLSKLVDTKQNLMQIDVKTIETNTFQKEDLSSAYKPYKSSPCKKCPALTAGGMCKCALKRINKAA